MTIKAVLFDLGNTVIRSSQSAFETVQKILEREGVSVSVEDVGEAFVLAQKEMRDRLQQPMWKIPPLEFYTTLNSHVLKNLGIKDLRILARKIREQWSDTIDMHMFPDVKPTLTILKNKKMKTGIISNRYQEEIQETCERAGLDDTLLDIIVGVDTARKAKPDPGIFMYALKKLKISPEEAIYVGDNIKRDYRAAEKVGMIPFLIVREKGTDIPEGIRCIRNLMSLIDLAGYLQI